MPPSFTRYCFARSCLYGFSGRLRSLVLGMFRLLLHLAMEKSDMHYKMMLPFLVNDCVSASLGIVDSLAQWLFVQSTRDQDAKTIYLCLGLTLSID